MSTHDNWKTSAAEYEAFSGDSAPRERCERCSEYQDDCDCPEICEDCNKVECTCTWDNSYEHPTTGEECFNVGVDGIYTVFSNGRSTMFYSYKGIDHPKEDEPLAKWESRGHACRLAQRLFNEASVVAPIEGFVQFGRFSFFSFFRLTDRDGARDGRIEEAGGKMILKIGSRTMDLDDNATAFELLGMILEVV